MKILRISGIIALAIVLSIAFLWTVGALHFDGPGQAVTIILVLALVVALIFVKRWSYKLLIFVGWFLAVLGWWLTLKPTHDALWQPDVAQLASARIDGDVVTISNVRNCDYRSVSDYTPRWEQRSIRLSQITGADIAIDYWGSPWIAHPIVSFQFADAPPLCFSIETRKKVGQSYSAIGGLYRQFALIYIVADERDVMRLRTNYREGEDLYLYRTRLTAEQARERFLEYLHSVNQIHDTPRWYNAATTNCTTSIRQQHPSDERRPWDWRMLLNGKMDEMLYENGAFVTDGLPFTELKTRALIDQAAQAADTDPDFSIRIREGRPGMGVR